jgi:hypothetical protein
MNIRAAVLISMLLIATPFFAREKSDVLVMKNGDRMTCEIKGLEAGVLYVSLDYILGTSSVQWAKVDYLESSQLFIVKTEDGLVYTGALSSSRVARDRPVKIEVVVSPESTVAIDQKQVVAMEQTSGVLAALQRRHKLGSYLFERKPVHPIQPELPNSVSTRAMERSGELQFHFGGQHRHYGSYAKSSDGPSPASVAMEQLVLSGRGHLFAKLGAEY